MRLRQAFTSFAAAGAIAAAVAALDSAPATEAALHDGQTSKSAPVPTPRSGKLTDMGGKLRASMALPEANVPVPVPRPVLEEPEQTYLKFLKKAAPIEGYADYCRRLPSECVRSGETPSQVVLDGRMEAALSRVNQSVNKRITPASDMDVYGRDEFWAEPQMEKNGVLRGDCEDYVLTKRKELAREGVPQSAMMIVVVNDLNGQGHAVLAVRTNKGDYILDNLTDEIRLPAQTGYKFKRATSLENGRDMVVLADVKPRPDPIGQLISRLQP